MSENDYLAHYGIIGMRWGIKRAEKTGKSYRYKSVEQKHYDKKVSKLSSENKTGKKLNGKKLTREQRVVAKKKLDKAESKRKLYEQRDLNREKYVRSITVGQSIARSVWIGGINNGAYSRYRAAGESVVKSSLKTGLGLVAVTATGLLAAPVIAGVSRRSELQTARKQLKHDSLYHWGEKEDHKYIAKVKRSNGTYRYFYDKDEYQAFLKGESNGKVKDGMTRTDSFTDKTVFTENLSNDKLANQISNTMNDLKSKAGFLANLASGGLAAKAVTELLKKEPEPVRQAKDFVEKVVDSLATKHPKYLGKIQNPDGTFRYFYDQEEYNSYLERKKYQENEPDFMKNVPEIDPAYDPKYDVVSTNPKYDPMKTAYSTNCWLCSNAYELRKRGYDVQAGSMSSSKEDMITYSININAPNLDKELARGANTKFEQWYENPVTNPVYKRDELEEVLKISSVPNSRGQLNVQWKGGGGHSMVYEVDANKNVKIIDSQTHKEYEGYEINKLASRTEHIVYTRTDNLKLKEGVLDVLEEDTRYKKPRK